MKFNTSTVGLAFFAVSSLNVQAAQGIVPITSTQAAMIDASLLIKGEESAIKKAIAEAAPNISSFLKINSCLAGYNGSSLNTFAAPGKLYPNNNYIGGPMPTMYKHNKAICATVIRIHGWSMPSKNALRFEVVYKAEDSGESGKAEHEVQRQANGQWLFSR